MDDKFKELLNKWIAGTLSGHEAQQFIRDCQDPALLMAVEAWLIEQYNQTPKTPYFSSKQKKAIYLHAIGNYRAQLNTPDPGAAPDQLMQLNTSPLNQTYRRPRRRLLRTVVTLCILGCFAFLFYRLNQPSDKVAIKSTSTLSDIPAPVSATPTINWGQNSGNQAVDLALKNQRTRLHRDKDGCLVFNAVSANVPPSTVTVPLGSRPVHIKLPDGSQVWINTGSSLKFPGAFEGSKRTVSLTGEAYFEVAHQDKQLFEVIQGENVISVLGTHFNINGYINNPNTKVTLLEGLVAINHNSYLHPAQQAILRDGNIRINKEVDLQQVMAWKNNQFYFNGTPAEEILRQLSRWYKIDIVYKGNIPQGHYSGIISKDNSLSQVLSILEAGGMRFKLNQQTLWIL